MQKTILIGLAGLVGTLANIAPAAAVGATAVLSLASAVAAIKIGTSGIGAALKAAFAPAKSGGGGAAKAANQAADAQREADALLTRLTQQIHDRTVNARDLIRAMNREMRGRRMSSGKRVGVSWQLADSLDEGQRAVASLFDADASSRMTPLLRGR